MQEANPKVSDAWVWGGILGVVSACLVLTCVFFCVLLVAFNAATVSSGPQSPTFQNTSGLPEKNSFVGVWKYPDRWVWIKITEDGQAFQCRIAKDGTIFRSEGTLVEGNKILWQDIWGEDTITRESNRIVLNGKYGEFEYEFTDTEMDAACEAPF